MADSLAAQLRALLERAWEHGYIACPKDEDFAPDRDADVAHLLADRSAASLAACQRELASAEKRIAAMCDAHEEQFLRADAAELKLEEANRQAAHAVDRWERTRNGQLARAAIARAEQEQARAEAAEAERDRYKAAAEAFGIRLAPAQEPHA